MTIREAAQRIGKSESALRRAIKAKRLDAKLINGVYDISEEALNAHATPEREASAPTREIEELERLRIENETLRRELNTANRKLEEKDQVLEDNRQRQDTIILQLTRQLEQNQRILEAHQEPWYKKWFTRKRNSVI